MNYGENICFFNSIIQVLYSLLVFRDYINKLGPPAKGVAMKIEKLFSDCGRTTNNDGVCIDWSLHLEDSSNVQTISGMLHQLMDPRGEYLEKLQMY